MGEVKVVSDMLGRKAEMAQRSEAFIALPGATGLAIFLIIISLSIDHVHKLVELAYNFLFIRWYGTMEELLEMMTWSQLRIHKKPVSNRA